MKNLLVANQRDNKRYNQKALEQMLKAQVENSLDCGWNKEDIIILSNFEFKHMGVKANPIALNEFCFTGSKVFGVKWLFENTDTEVVWAHDLDAWQNVPFECPDFKDIGVACYSRPKFNGGSIFWRKTSKDILDEVVKTLTEDKANREEPTLNKILKLDKYIGRVTELNNTFNVGCSGYVKRYYYSHKPIRVCHFHPYNRIAWETHVLDRNDIGCSSVSIRLERVIRKYYHKLPIKLKGDFNEKKRKEAKKLMRTVPEEDRAHGSDIK